MYEYITSIYVADLNSKLQSLLERVEKLEEEKQQIREEFGHQRAKMKELYLQKEGKLSEVKIYEGGPIST